MKFYSGKIFTGLLGIILILLILNIASYLNIYFNQLDPNNYFFKATSFNLEKNLPSVFSSLLHFFASILLASVALSKLTIKPGKWFWWVLSFIFFFLSLDELLRLHEKIDEYSTIAMDLGFFLYNWILYYAVGLIILGSFIISPLFKLPRKIAQRFLIAGVIFLFGAVVLENLAGMLIVEEEITLEGILTTPEIFLLSTLEELLEMLGVSYFIYSILLFKNDYIKSKTQSKSSTTTN